MTACVPLKPSDEHMLKGYFKHLFQFKLFTTICFWHVRLLYIITLVCVCVLGGVHVITDSIILYNPCKG